MNKGLQLDQFSLRVHILFWTISVAVWVIFQMIFGEGYLEPLANKLCYLPSQMIITYAFLYVLIPALSSGKYLKFIIYFLWYTYLALVLARFLKIYVYETIIGADLEKDSIIDILTFLPALLGQYTIWVFLSPLWILMVVLLINHLGEKERVEKLHKEKMQAELQFLKAQIHPHFLFNTLNNLYTLSIKRSPKTAEIAGRLYQILNYMFNKDGETTIPIEEEIELIQNYIELEKIRYGDRLDLSFEKQIDDLRTPIVPLMLLSMIENAFKHGASGEISTPVIKINLSVKSGHLKFNIYNTKPKKPATDSKGYRKGIGIQNIKRQLAILYPSSYQYDINETANAYSVELTIDLTAYKPVTRPSSNPTKPVLS